MKQQFESQKNVSVLSVGVPVVLPNAALSAEGQQAVSEYFARMERELIHRAALGGGTTLSTFERTETLREMQAHLLSLIAAYQEIGDDEQTAITSALAQFGDAGAVSVHLRRAQTRNKIARLLRKNDHLLPAVLIPASLFGVSLALPFLTATVSSAPTNAIGQATTTTTAAFGWQVLYFLPFLAGLFNATVSRKWAVRGVVIGYMVALFSVLFISQLLGQNSTDRPASQMVLHFEMEGRLASTMLASAAFGLVTAYGTGVLKQKRKAA